MPEMREVTGATGDTFSILVDVADPSKVLKIGHQLEAGLKEAMAMFLKENLDVFTWSHSDMVGIDPRVMCHRLNVDPEKKAVRKKRRVGMAICTEMMDTRSVPTQLGFTEPEYFRVGFGFDI